MIGKAIDDDLARSDAGRGERLGRAPWIASRGLGLVDSPGRRKETRERARRRRGERAERRLGGLQLGDRRLAHDGNEGQIAGPTQFAEIEAFFKRSILAAQVEKTVSIDIDAGDTARLLLGVLLGIRVLARTKPERAVLEGVVRPALMLLEPSRKRKAKR